MEIISKNYTIYPTNSSTEKYFTEKSLFFDIECTGLSPRKSFIYLIGYATRKGNEVTITQLLAKNESEEIKIIEEFENVMSKYDTLLGFNSTRFDESFIIERCRKYKFDTKIKLKPHIDMYLKTTKARCLLDLPNYKQKTIEEFLGLHRDDKYNGGELIPIYQHFSLTDDKESKDLILLHNYEDVQGMIFISQILSYPDLLTSDLRYISHEINNDKLRFEIETDIIIPSSINKQREYGLYIIKGNRIYVTINLTNTTLYTFLPDYKNYYYLINEDMIVPKSIGESMDKSCRRPATRRDCKVASEDLFLPLPGQIDIPESKHLFYEEYGSKQSYISVKDIDSNVLVKIIRYMLKH
ncbi:MAG: ribonuclease H-like domain-containing protein [Pseudobutyrivibrio sp.]|nr:ribonuclease H-like domain-containing protein [Pseudobutyrivibrio sp.]